MLPDISKSKGKQTMKFGQLIEHNVRNVFLQKSCRKCGMETSFRPLFVSYEVKVNDQHLSFDIFWLS